MIREQFFSDPDNGLTTASERSEFLQTWNLLLDFEDECGKTLEEGYTKKEYISLLYSMVIRRRRPFYHHKFMLLTYVHYLITHGILPKEYEDSLLSVTLRDLSVKYVKRVLFYKNLPALQNAIETTIKKAEAFDPAKYDAPAAVLYLAWFGFTEEEILSLPRSAVGEYGVKSREKFLEMPSFVTSLLKRYRDARGFQQFSNGVTLCRYVPSENFIRTEESGKLTLPALHKLLYRFNCITDCVYSLRFNVIYLSGMFYRAYRMECESSHFDLNDRKFASGLFHTELDTRAKHLEMVRDYELYKQLLS